MIFSNEVKELLALTLKTNNQEDSKKLDEDSIGMKIIQNIKRDGSILNTFIPPDKYNFYVPQP